MTEVFVEQPLASPGSAKKVFGSHNTKVHPQVHFTGMEVSSKRNLELPVTFAQYSLGKDSPYATI